MNKLLFKRLSLSVILTALTLFSMAQSAASDSATPSIDTTMRSHDKIYVVMTVCLVILVTLFLYLIRIDRKVSRKEKMM